MKKYLISTLVLIMCFMQLVSYNPIYAATDQVRHATPFKIDIVYESLEHVIKNQEGIPMLSVQGNSPKVTIENNRKASNAINTFYEGKKKAFEALQKQYVKWAKKDYSTKTKEEKAYWEGYGLGMSYSTGRVDQQVISFIENNYEYAGGAHPNATRFAQNFNPRTGERLTLEDITTNLPQATEAINAYILKETKKYQYKDYFFEGYEKDIKDILTEDTWYFSDEGLVIICNEYIISPHVVGILEFTIPYQELTFIKPGYLPKNEVYRNQL